MRRNLTLAVLILVLSACSTLEYLWLVPRSHRELPITADLTNSQLLDAFEKVAAVELNAWTRISVTYRDDAAGVLEMGPFRLTNVVGFATRAEVNRQKNTLQFVVKGTGPYYSAIPVEPATQRVVARLSPKLLALDAAIEGQ